MSENLATDSTDPAVRVHGSSTRRSNTFARPWWNCNLLISVIVQDGVVVQVERIERKRFRRGER